MGILFWSARNSVITLTQYCLERISLWFRGIFKIWINLTQVHGVLCTVEGCKKHGHVEALKNSFVASF